MVCGVPIQANFVGDQPGKFDKTTVDAEDSLF